MLPLSKDILFINPPSAFTAYTGTKINAITMHFPLLSYMYLSGSVKQVGFETKVLDLGIEKDPWLLLPKVLEKMRPRIVAMTCTTPLFYEVRLIGMIAKAILGDEVCVVQGGTHVSALPEESLTETMCDAVVIGEGEITFKEICEGRPFNEIHGLVYRKDKSRRLKLQVGELIRDILLGKPKHLIDGIKDDEKGGAIYRNSPRRLMTNAELDASFADLDLYDLYRYKNSSVIARGYPIVQMETSRGCPFRCNFCSADDTYRTMSPERVIEEMKEFKKRGIKEIRIIDNQFAADMRRAKKIFELILREGLRFRINLVNGVRADRLDLELLQLCKRVGVYQLGIGFESGDQAALDSMAKGLRDAVKTSLKCMEIIRKSGIESVGFFILGAPADTEESLKRTIAFAKRLRPDYAKATIFIPFPDTRAYADFVKRGLIKSKQWDLYNIHKATDIYEHPNGLRPELLKRYYDLFYREYYLLNPLYLWERLWKSIRKGYVFSELWVGFRTFFPNLIPGNPRRSLKLRPIFLWCDVKRRLSGRPLTGQINIKT